MFASAFANLNAETSQSAPSRVHRSRWVVAICALLLLLPLCVTPVLPLIDFYNHLSRFYILAHPEVMIASGSQYAAAWHLLPNLGFDFIAVPLLRWIEPLLAAKILIAVTLWVQFFGVLFLHGSVWPRADRTLPAVLLTATLYSFILNWGFINFLLGLGLAFWIAGLWVRLRSKLLLATAVCSVGAMIVFFCHGFAFAIYGILVAGLELGWWLQSQHRTPGSLAARWAVLITQAVAPLLLFLNMPTASATGETGSTLDNVIRHSSAGSLGERLLTELIYRTETIIRVAETPYRALDLLTFIAISGLLLIGLRTGAFRFCRPALPAAAALAIAVIVVPPSLFGIGYVSDRLPLALAFAIIGGISLGMNPARHLLSALAVIALIRIAAVAIGWSNYRDDFQDFEAVSAAIPRGALAAGVVPGGEDPRGGPLPRCQMYAPLLLPTRGAVVPLFASPTAQPLRLDGRLAHALEFSRAGLPRTRGNESGRAMAWLRNIAAQGEFEYVLLCDRRRLPGNLPSDLQKVKESGNLSVFRIAR